MHPALLIYSIERQRELTEGHMANRNWLYGFACNRPEMEQSVLYELAFLLARVFLFSPRDVDMNVGILQRVRRSAYMKNT